MKIQYLGHSCFKLTESTGTTIVTDPFKNVGYELPENVTATAVTVSHHHYDHDNVSAIVGKPTVIEGDGFYELPGVEITGIKSYHDEIFKQTQNKSLVQYILRHTFQARDKG